MIHDRSLGRSAGGAAAVVALLERRTGQRIAPERHWRIGSALEPLLRARALPTIDALAARIAAGSEPGLDDAVVDALLNGETSFFRDAAVLDQAVAAVGAMETAAPGRRARIWSAACSTGQEALSLAILFREREALTGAACPEVRATDVSAAAIDRAREGRYTQFEIQRGLPVRRLVQWFEGEPDGRWRVRAELRARILYGVQNLVADPMPGGRFDLVLCRNVLFYLSPATRAHVLDRIATVLRPGGLLLLGAGETVSGLTDALVPSERVRGFYRPADGG